MTNVMKQEAREPHCSLHKHSYSTVLVCAGIVSLALLKWYSYLLLHLLFCSSHSINLCVHTLKSCVCLKQIRFFLWPFYDILWSLCKNNLLPWFFILIIYFNFWFLQKTNSKVLTFVDYNNTSVIKHYLSFRISIFLEKDFWFAIPYIYLSSFIEKEKAFSRCKKNNLHYAIPVII